MKYRILLLFAYSCLSVITQKVSASPEYIKYNSEPLHEAVMQGNQEMVENLIEAGADINALGNLSMTPLHWAVHEQHKEIVQLLLKSNAYVNARNALGYTPLHYAVFNMNKELIEQLLKFGASPHIKDNTGASALEWILRCPEKKKELLEIFKNYLRGAV